VSGTRRVVWFSCGAASALAAHMTLKKWRNKCEVALVYTDPGSEHEDNKRFLRECEEWLQHPVTVLKSRKYADTWDVFEKTRWLVGPAGARCTGELKKALRHEFQDIDRDVQIFGYTCEERTRAQRLMDNNPEIVAEYPLIDGNLTKADCLAAIRQAGIELPEMYKLGYRNNNCIGCVKGQSGYWNKIRRDFPDVFERMAGIERDIGAAICKSYAGDGIRKKVFLDELPPDAGIYEAEPDIECGILCQIAMQDETCDE